MTAQISDVANEGTYRRIVGNCKWFDGVRGFGFIGGTDGQEYFVHQSSIKSTGWRNLEVNQRVEFEVIRDNDRLKAVNVSAPGGKPVKCERKKNQNVCFAYKNGTCPYGANCKFSHTPTGTRNPSVARNMPSGGTNRYRRNMAGPKHSPVEGLQVKPESKGVCYSWRRGECFRGYMCRFDHPQDQKNCQYHENSKGVCYQWQEGKCNKGENCPFVHFPTE